MAHPRHEIGDLSSVNGTAESPSLRRFLQKVQMCGGQGPKYPRGKEPGRPGSAVLKLKVYLCESGMWLAA